MSCCTKRPCLDDLPGPTSCAMTASDSSSDSTPLAHVLAGRRPEGRKLQATTCYVRYGAITFTARQAVRSVMALHGSVHT